ncbi:hypothetical protein BJ546DRAFT_691505 [Cryomyces antarcticus]
MIPSDGTDDQERLLGLQELEPSPVEDTPAEYAHDSYFPSASSSSPSPPPLQHRSSTLGLSGHGPVYHLTRIQKYSSYAFSIFTAFHITNTSLIPLLTKSIPASDTYLLLTRPYYQSPLAEPVIVVLPLLAHVGSGVALRLYRRSQNLQRYGAESKTDRRRVAWPALSGTSLLGYILAPLVIGHSFVNRVLPLWVDGGSSGIGLGYVSHGFARHPLFSNIGFAALVSVGVWHSVWGWAKWSNLAPAQVTDSGAEGQRKRKRRWYGVNLLSAVVAGLWLAGGLGVVGRAGQAPGWVGREYDELYRRIPVFGRWA